MKALCGLAVSSLLAWHVCGSPAATQGRFHSQSKRTIKLAIDSNFPDPSIEQAWDGTWYAFATNGNGKNIQVASATSPDGPWHTLAGDALPNSGSWTTGNNNWAPDVKRMPPQSQSLYIMTYSGDLASSDTHHCVGIATSHNIAGPYTPLGDGPVICPDIASTGGAIDSSSYYDQVNNKRYTVYKEDGNGVGNGGDCNNGIPPIHSTPFMLQEMDVNDWTTPVGSPVQILDRITEDGPLIEAPNIIGKGGYYILFYSSHCFTDTGYDIKYAVAKNIKGPYTRKGQLLATGDYGLKSPGGATAAPGGDVLLFHANCSDPNPDGLRCMHTIDMSISNGVVTLDG